MGEGSGAGSGSEAGPERQDGVDGQDRIAGQDRIDAGHAQVISGQFGEVAPGVRLHYASCGDPANPLMLMLHGFPEFWGAWRTRASASHCCAPRSCRRGSTDPSATGRPNSPPTRSRRLR